MDGEGQTHRRWRGFVDPPPAPLLDKSEFKIWSFYRDLISEFIATLLFLYVAVCTVVTQKNQTGPSDGVGRLLDAWAFGGMTFVLVYCTAGVSGGYINPAVTLGLFLARKMSLNRAVAYMMAQCLGAICGVGLVKASLKPYYNSLGGGANSVAPGYSTGTALVAEIFGTFVLVFTVLSATDPKRRARDSHEPGLAPLPIGFAVFIVHLATSPITGTGINPARSFGAAVIYNHRKVWADQWLFWFGPFVGALAATAYHQHILRSAAIKAVESFRNNRANSPSPFRAASPSSLPSYMRRSHPRTRGDPPGNFYPRGNFDPRDNFDPRGNPPGNNRPGSNPNGGNNRPGSNPNGGRLPSDMLRGHPSPSGDRPSNLNPPGNFDPRGNPPGYNRPGSNPPSNPRSNPPSNPPSNPRSNPPSIPPQQSPRSNPPSIPLQQSPRSNPPSIPQQLQLPQQSPRSNPPSIPQQLQLPQQSSQQPQQPPQQLQLPQQSSQQPQQPPQQLQLPQQSSLQPQQQT